MNVEYQISKKNTIQENNLIQYDFTDDKKLHQVQFLGENSCVYALLDENKNIVYIGRTKYLLNRIAAHLKDKKFVYFKYFEISEEEAPQIELLLYEKYRPIYNKVPPQCPEWISISQFRRKHDLKGVGWKIRKYIASNPVKDVCGLYPTKYLETMKEEVLA